jgi:hypothetical protein
VNCKFKKNKDEKAFFKCGPIIRSVLASLIIQWDCVPDQPARNISKTLELTTKLLNLINRVSFKNTLKMNFQNFYLSFFNSILKKLPNLLPKPLCYIIDIIPLLSTYEVHILLIIIWKYLKFKMQQQIKLINNSDDVIDANPIPIDIQKLKNIFHKNINKLAPLYSYFFF